MSQIKTKNQNNITVFLIILFFILQLIYIFFPNPMISVSDEIVYKEIAEDIFSFNPVSSFHYPFLYPLFLTPGFLAGENFYYFFLLLNVIYKTASLFIISVLLDKLEIRKNKPIIVIMIAVCPIYFFWTKYLMSENIFAPLLILSVLFYCLHDKNRNVDQENHKDIGTTIVAATFVTLLFWTKYLAFVFFPIFFLYWCGFFDIPSIYKNKETTKIKEIAIRSIVYIITIAVLIVGYAFIWSIWSNNVFSIATITNSMGFSIGSGPQNTGYFSLPSIKWVIAYSAYAFIISFVLLLPFLYRKATNSNNRKIYFFLITVALILIFVSARHSTFRGEVDGMMVKLVARYIEYLPLLCIIAYAFFADQQSQSLSMKVRFMIYIGGFIAIILGYYFLYTNVFLNCSEEWLGLYRGMSNISFYSLGSASVVLLGILLGLAVIVNRKWYTVFLWIFLCLENIICGIYEVNLERNRHCKDAYYKIIHMGEWVSSVLKDEEGGFSVFFNRVELAAPMQYAVDFFDNDNHIRWCPIVYWASHTFELSNSSNYYIAMEEDINMQRYLDQKVNLCRVKKSPGIVYFEWTPDIFSLDTFQFDISTTDDGIVIIYKGGIDTVLVYDNKFYYAENIEDNKMKVCIAFDDISERFFELYNIKELKKSKEIYFNDETK